MTLDWHAIEKIEAVNVAVGRQTIIADGMPIELPARGDLLAYLLGMREEYKRWADHTDTMDAPLIEPVR